MRDTMTQIEPYKQPQEAVDQRTHLDIESLKSINDDEIEQLKETYGDTISIKCTNNEMLNKVSQVVVKSKDDREEKIEKFAIRVELNRRSSFNSLKMKSK